MGDCFAVDTVHSGLAKQTVWFRRSHVKCFGSSTINNDTCRCARCLHTAACSRAATSYEVGANLLHHYMLVINRGVVCAGRDRGANCGGFCD